MRIVIDPMMPPGLPERLAEIETLELARPHDSDGVTAALERGSEILVTYRWREDFLQPSLRWVASVSVGVDQYPLEELARREVVVTSARGVTAIPVAEHAMALLLSCSRRIGESSRDAVHRTWVRRPSKLELFGSTMVVLGLGTIGEEIAVRAQAFGMSVIGIKRDTAGYRGAVQDVRPPSALVASCREAQVLMCAAPGGESTRHLIDAEVLDALGRGVLVNVGRGSTVDEPALIRALQERRLLAAGLDVFEAEPLPDTSPLWGLPSVVITAHAGGLGPKYGDRWVELFSRNLTAYLRGGTWTNLVAGRENRD